MVKDNITDDLIGLGYLMATLPGVDETINGDGIKAYDETIIDELIDLETRIQLSYGEDIFLHDLANYTSAWKMRADMRKIQNVNSSYVVPALNAKIFGMTLAYIGTGDEDLIMDIPVWSIPEIMQFSGEVEFAKLEGDNIYSPEYVAMKQMVKNAVDCKLYVDEKIISVVDEGQGITHLNGAPLGPDLHMVFERFSTKGSGLGLQKARELAHMRGGHIEVETTTSYKGDFETWNYSTLDENSVQHNPREKTGTEFRIHLPKK